MGVASVGVGSYNDTYRVRNTVVRLVSRTLYTEDGIGLADEETTGLVTPFADLKLWECVRYGKVKTETLITKG